MQIDKKMYKLISIQKNLLDAKVDAHNLLYRATKNNQVKIIKNIKGELAKINNALTNIRKEQVKEEKKFFRGLD